MTANTPPCPMCGHPTTLHCRYCDWYECLSCDIRGIRGHDVIPRNTPGRDKPRP